MHQPQIGESVILVVVSDPAPGEHGEPVEMRYAGTVTAIRDGGGIDIQVDELGKSFSDVMHGREGVLDDEFYLFSGEVEANDAETAAANPPIEAYPAETVSTQPHAMPGMDAMRPATLAGDALANWCDGFDAGYRAATTPDAGDETASPGESDASPAGSDAAGTGNAAPADAGEGESLPSPSAPAAKPAWLNQQPNA
jgi:hypothetical protein